MEKHRVQFDFSPEAYERLQAIRESSGAASNAEVVRNALRLYEWFLKQQREGYSVQVAKDDFVKEVELFI